MSIVSSEEQLLNVAGSIEIRPSGKLIDFNCVQYENA